MAYCEAVGNGFNVLLSSKQLIKGNRTLRTSKKAFIGDIPFKSSVAKEITIWKIFYWYLEIKLIHYNIF